MEAVVGRSSVRIIGKALQCLSKIGSDLFFEAFRDQLVMRTVNSSRSAYACYAFRENFFEEYRVEGVSWAPAAVQASSQSQDDSQMQPTQSSQTDAIRCKALSKCCSNVFKLLASSDKNVEKCIMNLNDKENRLIFKMYCKHGIVKTYRLLIEDSETLQAVYNRHRSDNMLTIPAKLLSELTSHFQPGMEEISFRLASDSVVVENYIEESPDINHSSTLCTKIVLNASEFPRFSVQKKACLTFCLKELRTASSFCDFSQKPITAYFEAAGKPIIFSVSGEDFDSDYVLATLDSSQAEELEDDSQPLTKPTQMSDATQQSYSYDIADPTSGVRMHVSPELALGTQANETPVQENLSQGILSPNLSDGSEVVDQSKRMSRVHSPALSHQENKSFGTQQRPTFASPAQSTATSHGLTNPTMPSIPDTRATDPETSISRSRRISSSEDESESEFIESTPPRRKKYKSLFAVDVAEDPRILVGDSDEG
eukprot:m.230648 g.230648  ORF g.230648 m.230648 type:complete len:483 (-) comp16001_c0_seq6:2246-3694(-)